MNWTKTPPTKPGVYLLRKAFSGSDTVVQVAKDLQCQAVGYPWARHVSDWGGEWCGPLVPVEEVRRAYYEGHIYAISSDPEVDPQELSWPNSRARKIVEGELQ